VVPLFAFVNTGILLAPGSFQSETSLQIAGGVIIGLVVGKMIGIAGVTWLMVKLKLAYKPDGANWSHIVGVALLAGIGFTVSIFVTDLSFVREEYIIAAKLSIFVASFISAVLGLIVFRFMSGSKTA
jgi:NhaA family Na+:H+ antiporter